jgi:hypothetical protein
MAAKAETTRGPDELGHASGAALPSGSDVPARRLRELRYLRRPAAPEASSGSRRAR